MKLTLEECQHRRVLRAEFNNGYCVIVEIAGPAPHTADQITAAFHTMVQHIATAPELKGANL